MTNVRRVGVYGGMFDPVHQAHIQVATGARERLGLDSVLLVPCGNPVHRGRAQASDEQRLAMLRLATADECGLYIESRELDGLQPSYTCDTLASLRREQPGTSWHLMLGADAFLSLPSWKNWQSLFSLANIVVITRPGHVLLHDMMTGLLRAMWDQRMTPDIDALAKVTDGVICCLDLQTEDISSTRVRDLIKTGLDTSSILHPAVAAYIAEQHLYSQGGID